MFQVSLSGCQDRPFYATLGNKDRLAHHGKKWIEAGHYIDRGAMFSGGMRISSWSVDLRRIEPD
jgi:hypothetical protein